MVLDCFLPPPRPSEVHTISSGGARVFAVLRASHDDSSFHVLKLYCVYFITKRNGEIYDSETLLESHTREKQIKI